ncbi:Uncharacterised protein [Escherichia coli]|nr:Uncharacterised protein [Escherichia coli]
MRASGGDARQNAFVVAIFRNTSPVSVVQADGEAVTVTAVNGGMVGTDAPKQHSRHRPPVLMDRAPGKPVASILSRYRFWPLRHHSSRGENPASQSPPDGSIPEQRVTVRHPVLKAPSCQMWHTAEFVNVTPADQPPGQCTFYLQRRSASLSQGRPPG